MSYNLSLNAFLRWKHVLDMVLANPEAIVVVDSDNPHMTAYKIREAHKAAQANNTEPYASLDLITSARRDAVHVSLRAAKEPMLTLAAPPEGVYTQPTTAFDVVEVLTKEHPPIASFPNFDDNVESISSWADKRGYEILNTSPLTLRKNDDG